MEVAESSVELEDSKTASQHSLHKNKADTVSKDSTSAEVTTQDLLPMFGHNEEILQYYLGLKEAVIESRRRGEVCWCDPREAKMKEKLAATGWKPRIIFRLPPEQQDGCDPDGVEYSSKQVALDEDGSEDDVAADTRQGAGDDRMKMEADKRSFTCELGGCKQTFTSLASYESHYHTCHNYVCGTCRSSFISAFLLDVHLEENHDSYFQVLSSRTDMFRCLVESCSLKFRTPDLRKDHLVKVHKLPANFMFHKPMKTKSRKTKAALKKSQSAVSGTESNDMDVVDESQSSNMECDAGKTKNHRKGKKIPQAFSFGRGAHKAFSHRTLGRGRHWHQLGSTEMDTAVDIEKVDFTDMVESLECS